MQIIWTTWTANSDGLDSQLESEDQSNTEFNGWRVGAKHWTIGCVINPRVCQAVNWKLPITSYRANTILLLRQLNLTIYKRCFVKSGPHRFSTTLVIHGFVAEGQVGPLCPLELDPAIYSASHRLYQSNSADYRVPIITQVDKLLLYRISCRVCRHICASLR